jgi:hypothetical protein
MVNRKKAQRHRTSVTSNLWSESLRNFSRGNRTNKKTSKKRKLSASKFSLKNVTRNTRTTGKIKKRKKSEPYFKRKRRKSSKSEPQSSSDTTQINDLRAEIENLQTKYRKYLKAKASEVDDYKAENIELKWEVTRLSLENKKISGLLKEEAGKLENTAWKLKLVKSRLNIEMEKKGKAFPNIHCSNGIPSDFELEVKNNTAAMKVTESKQRAASGKSMVLNFEKKKELPSVPTQMVAELINRRTGKLKIKPDAVNLHDFKKDRVGNDFCSVQGQDNKCLHNVRPLKFRDFVEYITLNSIPTLIVAGNNKITRLENHLQRKTKNTVIGLYDSEEKQREEDETIELMATPKLDNASSLSSSG